MFFGVHSDHLAVKICSIVKFLIGEALNGIRICLISEILQHKAIASNCSDIEIETSELVNEFSREGGGFPDECVIE